MLRSLVLETERYIEGLFCDDEATESAWLIKYNHFVLSVAPIVLVELKISLDLLIIYFSYLVFIKNYLALNV